MSNDNFNQKAPPIFSPALPGTQDIHSQGEITVRDIYDLVRAERWTVALITGAVMMLAVLFGVVVSPTYKADGLVQVEEDSKSGAMSSMSDLSSLFLGTPVETAAEIEILKSRMVLDQVIDKENLEIEAAPHRFPILGSPIARWNGHSQKPVGAVPGFRRFGWGGERIVVTTFNVPQALINKHFTLTSTETGFDLDDPEGDKVLSGKIGEMVSGTSAAGAVSMFVQVLEAQPGTKFSVTHFSHQDTLEKLVKKLSVQEQGVQSGVIAIGFTGKSPGFVSDVINDIENAYLRQNVERRSADAQKSLDFLEKQLPSLKQKLDEAQANLTGYQTSHGSVDVTQETAIVLQQNVDLETQRLTLVQQREQALQRYTPEHPFVKALDQQIQSLDQELDKLKERTGKLPTSQQEVLSLLRDQDVNVQLYTAMLNSMQELQVAKAGTVGNVRIVDYAMKPFRPSFPKLGILLVIGTILGFISGLAYIFLQRALLKGVDDPAQIERHFNIPVIASIPYAKEQKSLAKAILGVEQGNHILALVDPENIAVEALRSLRTSLHFAMLEARNNVIMFTGPAPGLGKSFLTTNLGAILAISGKRIIIIDADLRRGHLHQFVGAKGSPGISEYVVGDVQLDAVIRNTAQEGLDIIPRGVAPPNPAELLMHERFSKLIESLSDKYDYVLVDTPPILAVTDASIVGKLAGTTMIVLKSAEHPLREIDESIKRLVGAGIRPSGIVLNQVGLKGGSYGHGNYGYSYYKYESR